MAEVTPLIRDELLPPRGPGRRRHLISITDLTKEDVERLREAGFDDRAVLQINLIASWFNYVNRVADGLGVGRPDPR